MTADLVIRTITTDDVPVLVDLWRRSREAAQLAALEMSGRAQAEDDHMHMPDIPFEMTDWSEVPATDHPGVTGVARWRTRQIGAIRVRMVEYSPGYLADHWCEKGHVLLCLEGSLTTELSDGRTVVLAPGMTYHVGDGVAPHRSSTPGGARLFIVD